MNDGDKKRTKHIERISRISFIGFALIVILIIVMVFLYRFSIFNLGRIPLYLILPLCGLMFILMIPADYVSIQRNKKYRKRNWYKGVVLLFLGVILISFNTYLILFHPPIIPLSIGLYSLGQGIILNGATHILFLKRFYDKAEKDL